MFGMRKSTLVSLPLLVLGIATSLNAQSIQINFSNDGRGPLTAAESVVSVAHERGLSVAENAWNNLSINAPEPGVIQHDPDFGSPLVDTFGDSTGANLFFSEGATNVDFSLGFSSPMGSPAEDTNNPGEDGTDGNGLYEEVWFGRPGDEAIGFQITGLSQGSYDVFVYSAESNNPDDRTYEVSYQTDNDSISSFSDGVVQNIGFGNDTSAFVDGLNFSSERIEVGMNDNLVVFISALNANGDDSFPSIGALQIIADLPPEGDVDDNGTIDLVDFGLIRDNFFDFSTDVPPVPVFGEAVGARDGVVDIRDFIVWKNAFEALGGDTSGLTVPEPGSGVMLICSTGLLALLRRRDSRVNKA